MQYGGLFIAYDSIGTTGNEWDYLTERFLNISNQKYQLDHILTSMIPKISKEFYFELLNGRPMELPYIQDILKHIDSPLNAEGSYTSIALTFSDLADTSLKLRLMENITKTLDEFSGSLLNYIIQQIDETLYIVIVQYGLDASEFQTVSFEIRLEQVFFNSLMGRQSLAWMEIGPICDSIQNVSYSYLESLQRLTKKKYLDKTLKKKSYDSVPDAITPNNHYFRIQLKTISDFIMGGEADAALQKALQISGSLLMRGTTKEICRSFEYYRLAFLDILASYHIMEASEEALKFIFDEMPDSLKNTEQPYLLKEYMDRFCSAAVNLLDEKYKKQQHKYLIRAKQYIESSYQNPDLSLNSLAEQCKTTTSYLSRLFKESFGINFIEYLNQYRIDKAKELLRTTDQTIKEIALSTGFNSLQNFIRVFKKYTGMTPGQFKAEM